MKKPIHGNGLALAKSLYSRRDKTEANLVNPIEDINPTGRPCLIPGVEYPTTQREEHLIDLAYAKGYKDAFRLPDESDALLHLMAEKVEEIRKEKIINGRLKPASIKERKWRLGI